VAPTSAAAVRALKDRSLDQLKRLTSFPSTWSLSYLVRTQIFDRFALVLIPDSRSCFDVEVFIDIFHWSPYSKERP
jgi:hypothetical protein